MTSRFTPEQNHNLTPNGRRLASSFLHNLFLLCPILLPRLTNSLFDSCSTLVAGTMLTVSIDMQLVNMAGNGTYSKKESIFWNRMAAKAHPIAQEAGIQRNRIGSNDTTKELL